MADTVLDLSTNTYTAAWLYGFDVDSHTLKPAHLQWLSTVMVERVAGRASPGTSTPAGQASPWYIWITGAASRTGSRLHNLALSKRRADAVKDYVEWKLRPRGAAASIQSGAIGENFWALIGRADEVESRYQRGLLVVAQHGRPVKPDVKVPVPKKPHVPVAVTFCFAAERRSFANLNRWNGTLYAFARTTNKDPQRHARVWWPARASGINVDPTAVVKAPPSLSKDIVFAGYDRRTFNSIYDLDYLGQNFVSVTTLHYGMTFKIKDALPGSEDMTFRFDANVGWELGQTAVAAIGKMQPLTTDLYQKAFPLGLPTWSDKDKEWTFVA